MSNNLHEKIAKILRLAENAGTEGERDAAVSRAQALAFKYNLDLSTIDIEEKDTNQVKNDNVGIHETQWEHVLLHGIANVNFCRVYWIDYSRGKRSHYLVGRPHNIDITNQMFGFISNQIRVRIANEVSARGQLPRYALISVLHHAFAEGFTTPAMYALAKTDIMGLQGEVDAQVEKAWADLVPRLGGDDGLNLIRKYTHLTKAYASEIRPYIKRKELAPEIVDDLKTWREGFSVGIVGKVNRRLWDEYLNLEANAGDDGKALVRRESQALDKFMEEEIKAKPSDSTRNRQRDFSAMLAGQKAGEEISLQDRKSLDNRKEIES